MRIYYINLDRRSDRRAEMEAQFDRLGFRAERISAFTPSDVTSEQIALHCDPRNRRWMTEAELSCSLSHLKALENFRADRSAYAVILEDDVRLSPSLPAFLANFEAHPAACDILRLETYLDRQRLTPKPFDTFGDIEIRQSWS